MDREATIHDRLVESLAPVALEIHDESHMHSVPKGAQTHFKVVVVSDVFENASLVVRHRRVNAALADELATGLHALSIHAFTPTEWATRGGDVPSSPPCLGGSKR